MSEANRRADLKTQIVRELVSPETVERAFWIAAAVGPVIGLFVGGTIGYIKRSTKRGLIGGFLLGLLTYVVYGMWRIFNVVTDKLGLDSVANLVVELFLFAAVGMLIGAIAAKLVVVLKRV